MITQALKAEGQNTVLDQRLSRLYRTDSESLSRLRRLKRRLNVNLISLSQVDTSQTLTSQE
jgi:hypothetical protein